MPSEEEAAAVFFFSFVSIYFSASVRLTVVFPHSEGAMGEGFGSELVDWGFEFAAFSCFFFTDAAGQRERAADIGNR